MQKVHDKPIYLDYASTTPIRPEIIADAHKIQQEFFENADSLHYGGQRVSDLVTKSRQYLAKQFNVLPQEVIFTSGASESNSAAIKGIAFANKHLGNHIITSKVEHSSVMGACKQLEDVFGFEVDYVGVDETGSVDLHQLKQLIRKDTILVALLAVNNEVGSINDIQEITSIVKKNPNTYLHIDGVQALARHDFELKQIDSVSFSAHKIYGVKGSGLWILKAHTPCLPLINGGQQQYGKRGGTTDNVAAILWAKTLRLALEDSKTYYNHVQELSNLLYETFENEPGIVLNSSRLGSPYIFNMSVLNVGSEIMMNGLNAKGIAVSAQSTCNSQSLKPSHVLMAMGANEKRALSSVRISLSHLTTRAEIEKTIETIMEIKKYVQHEL
ncbi:cysteine desulfurase [Erysipelothrix inopinata]|uniref:Cysteine desulfurase n=1 Tax=Erysipelothrix inopinata TaxID=225084 RepID=A0A7G9RYD1_9FIRM|nr:cysteine desulfurase family protein [Erysipelothrix inopinata]QNN60606.1 cysteine desulfurase [Erysipelothrix inopinata]